MEYPAKGSLEWINGRLIFFFFFGDDFLSHTYTSLLLWLPLPRVIVNTTKICMWNIFKDQSYNLQRTRRRCAHPPDQIFIELHDLGSYVPESLTHMSLTKPIHPLMLSGKPHSNGRRITFPSKQLI